jgi:hypothetical protein
MARIRASVEASAASFNRQPPRICTVRVALGSVFELFRARTRAELTGWREKLGSARRVALM